MLKEIIAEFQHSDGPLCAEELSRSLDIEVSALKGMLQTLVRSGRLQEIDPTDQGCVACAAKGSCMILTNGVQKSYLLRSEVK